MKRQKSKAKRANAGKPSNSASSSGSQKAPDRREFLRKLRNWALIGGGVGAGGWYLVQDVSATAREQDLSRIGNGTPAVVQIHDPQCPSCVALQREARKALADFDDDELQYLVANIRKADGRALAAAHGVGHVTLLLFDAQGQQRGVLAGANESENLKRAFQRHLARNGAS